MQTLFYSFSKFERFKVFTLKSLNKMRSLNESKMNWMNNLSCMMKSVRKNWRMTLKEIHRVKLYDKFTDLNNLMSCKVNLMMSWTCYNLKRSLNCSCYLNKDYLSSQRRYYKNLNKNSLSMKRMSGNKMMMRTLSMMN